MISKNKFVCDLGENAALNYYLSKGYKLIEKNWRYHNLGEIDIIAFDSNNDMLIFSEVKTRKFNINYNPSDSVGFTKQKKIKKLSGLYVYENRQYDNSNIRYDVIEVILYQNNILLNCLENAF